MTAYVLYDNVFNQAGGVLTYTSQVGNSGPYAHDMLLFDRWIHGQSGSYVDMKVDLLATYETDTWSIFGHNLGTNSATVTLFGHTGSAWVQVDTVTPSDDSPIFRRFTAVSYVSYLVKIDDASSDDELYHVAVGKGLQLKPLNTGFKPPMFEQFSAKNSVNRHGVLLGRSVAKVARKLSIRQNAITSTELYSGYKPWLDHAAKYPFLFCWDYENHPGDTVFCWLDDTAPDPVYSNLCHLSIDMQVKAMLWHEIPS